MPVTVPTRLKVFSVIKGTFQEKPFYSLVVRLCHFSNSQGQILMLEIKYGNTLRITFRCNFTDILCRYYSADQTNKFFYYSWHDLVAPFQPNAPVNSGQGIDRDDRLFYLGDAFLHMYISYIIQLNKSKACQLRTRA